jgi:hypothetical protein
MYGHSQYKIYNNNNFFIEITFALNMGTPLHILEMGISSYRKCPTKAIQILFT